LHQPGLGAGVSVDGDVVVEDAAEEGFVEVGVLEEGVVGWEGFLREEAEGRLTEVETAVFLCDVVRRREGRRVCFPAEATAGRVGEGSETFIEEFEGDVVDVLKAVVTLGRDVMAVGKAKGLVSSQVQKLLDVVKKRRVFAGPELVVVEDVDKGTDHSIGGTTNNEKAGPFRTSFARAADVFMLIELIVHARAVVVDPRRKAQCLLRQIQILKHQVRCHRRTPFRSRQN